MEVNKIPKRKTSAILNSLGGGVVPRIGLEYITVGRKQEIDALLNDINIIEEGGASFRFILGKYGSGKSYLLQLIRSYSMDSGFVVVDSDLSPERRFVGSKGQGLASYKELIKNMSTKTNPDGGALKLIIEKWISSMKSLVIKKYSITPDDPLFLDKVEEVIMEAVGQIEGMVHGFEFSWAMIKYFEAYIDGDDQFMSAILKWFRGEYTNKTEAKKAIGINEIINDENWYEYLKILSQFMVTAGYKGLIVIFDELVNLYRIPNGVVRQSNYEKILTMFNDTMQGKASNIGIIMGGTPQFVEDDKKGLFSYEAIKSRLVESRFSNSDFRDMLSPIIRLNQLTNEELFVLAEKIANIHSLHYGYENTITQDDLLSFLNVEFSRVGSDEHITPREVIRDFISVLNIKYQNKERTIKEIIGDKSFKFSKDSLTDEEIHEEFAEFSL